MNSIQTLLTDHLDIWTTSDAEKKSGRGRSAGNADRVYGIRKLRELILELAVRGKLVPQDPNDEPASVLLKRIRTEKAKLIAEGKIKKDKPLAPITEDEKPFELPQGWEWTRVAQVGHDWGQKSPDSDFTYIEVSAIDSLRGIVSSPELVKPENAPSRARKVVKKGSVIYSTIRPYLLNVAVIEDDFLPEPIASTAFAIVHPFCLMPPRFFLCLFRSPVFVRHVESVQMGIAYPAINDGQFFSSLIPVPPIAEQHRIVAKVDELMALCDQLEQQQTHSLATHQTLVASLLGTLTRVGSQQEFSAAWARIASHFDTLFTTEASIDQLKQTLLQLAVMGKLVPQDPNDEPANALLKRIQAEKAELIADGKIKKDKPLPPITDEEKPFELPEGWQWVKCQDVCLKITDGEHATPSRSESGYFLLSARNVTNEGIILDDVDYVPLAEFERIRNRCNPNIGDILISCSGSVGRVALVDKDNAYSMVRSAAMIRPNNKWLRIEYLALLLRSVYLQDQMKRRSKQSAQANLFLGAISNLVLIIPPLPEQHRIVAKVDELMALCDTLKARLADAQTIQLHLADAIVEQAIC